MTFPKSHCEGVEPVPSMAQLRACALSSVSAKAKQNQHLENWILLQCLWCAISDNSRAAEPHSERLAYYLQHQLPIASWSTISQACDIARRVKVASPKPGDQSFVPRPPPMVERGWHLQEILWPPHMTHVSRDTWVHLSAHTHQRHK